MTAMSDFGAINDILHQELCQNILCLKAGELIAAAKKCGLDVENSSVRALVHELATILQQTGYVPGAYYDSDAPEPVPHSTVLN